MLAQQAFRDGMTAMGKKKTFPAGRSEFLDWAVAAGFEATYEDASSCYAGKLIDGVRRQIRLDRNRDVFELCDGNFDRWANSVGATGRFPRTEAEFARTLERLLADTVKSGPAR